MIRTFLSGRLVPVLCLTMLGASGIAAFGQGFGAFKMDAILNRKSPPRVYLMGTAISVRSTSLAERGMAYTGQLASTVESELFSHDSRLKADPHSPETIISCEITRLDSEEKWEARRSREQRKTGERQEYNQKKQKYETKPVYEEVEVTRNFKIVTGFISVSYQAKDVKTGAVLDSDTLPLNYRQEFLDGNGALSPSAIENDLVRRVAMLIVPRLTPTTESVKVLLSKGKLEKTAKLGDAGLWQKMVEGFETMEPLKDSKDDAYRLYNIGVGYEALAYQAEDLATTKKFLDKASVLYNQAIEGKPDEKYFRDPQRRIQQAIIQYRKLEDQMAAYANAKALKEQQEGLALQTRQASLASPKSDDQGSKQLRQADPPANPPKPEAQNDKAFTNQDVIDLVNKGLNDVNLIAVIKQAPAVRFDLRATALGVLLQQKVSNEVIAAMRTRQSPAGNTTRRSRTAKNE